ncbi:MAG: hypothetical protein DCF15_01275 [Phormidesmis priestleyi]|uniref:Nuclease n=1 Tax=Phormidesmis priestleyi TaxID=268141 RepID=A0A2W4Y225_9CYAN|nr:MAG: hypothetical protein DCF15_01275 [Phormidesmis priestleyi]
MIAEEFKAQLEAACDDLWWSSEADYPVEMVWQAASQSQSDESDEAAEPTEITEAVVLQLAGCAAEASEPIGVENSVESVEIESFFEQALAPKPWHTAADKAQIAQLQHLKTLLANSLKNLQVYRCGEVEITALVLGFATDSIIAGVKTTLVET